jgi:hypothetical protein
MSKKLLCLLDETDDSYYSQEFQLLCKTSFPEIDLVIIESMEELDAKVQSNKNASGFLCDYRFKDLKGEELITKVLEVLKGHGCLATLFVTGTYYQTTLKEVQHLGASTLYFKPAEFSNLLEDFQRL